MQFSEIFGKIVCWRPPSSTPESCRPSLWKSYGSATAIHAWVVLSYSSNWKKILTKKVCVLLKRRRTVRTAFGELFGPRRLGGFPHGAASALSPEGASSVVVGGVVLSHRARLTLVSILNVTVLTFYESRHKEVNTCKTKRP